MRRILAMLLAILAVFSLLPVSALADDGTLVLRTESATALIGSEVDVTFSTENNPGLSGLQVQLEYDSSILTLTGVDYTDSTTTGLTSQPSQKLTSPVKLTWYNGTADSTYNGVMATLHFTVSASATSGSEAALHLIIDEENVCNVKEENVPFEAVDGQIFVISYTPGDINNDQRVNVKDLIRLAQYLADWEVEVVEACLDTNGDGKTNVKDAIRLAQYLADWDVELFPKAAVATCEHTLSAVEAKAATCVAEGNIAYWVCSKCGKLFADSEGQVKTDADAVKTAKDATNHANIVIDAAVPATSTSTGLTEGSHCAVDGGKGCGAVIVAQEIVTIPVKSHTITYNLAFGQTYLSQKLDILEERNKDNPTSYNEGDEFLLNDLDASDLGFTFEGWYTASGTRVDHIDSTDTKNFILYAHWTEVTYSIQYNVFKTPVAEVTDSAKLSYTASNGLYALPNPDVYNCIFLGWYDSDGNEVTSIPVGSTGNKVLNAYFTTKRNYAVGKTLGEPIRVVDSDNGVLLFAYEIGTIKNVPVSDAIWEVQAVSGLAQKTSTEVTTSISKTLAQTISDTVAQTSQNSNTWSLSSEWNDVTIANKEWSEEQGMTQQEATERAKTQAGTLSTTSSNGGSDTTTDNSGTTTLNYNSKNTMHEDDKATQWDVHGKLSAGVESKTGIEVGAEIGIVNASVNKEFGWHADIEVSGGYEDTTTTKDSTDEKTGTDTTTLNTHTSTSVSSWNKSTTTSQTTTDSLRESTNTALSHAIAEKTGYTTQRSNGSTSGSTNATANTASSTSSSSNTVTYSEQTVTTVTKEYSTDGKSEGWYRLVMAADVHVFGVVGYDIAARSYFTYTYSIVDGNTYEFLDYSPDGVFNDMQNTVLPFKVPVEIYDYAKAISIETTGLEYKYSSDHTATVIAYTGESTEVNVPTYTVDANGAVYRVTGLSANAFAGKSITKINLSRKITSIPANAFQDCTALEYVNMYSVTSIGDSAFAGCTSLKNFCVSSDISELGSGVFAGCPSVEITTGNVAVAVAAASCGADNITLDVSGIDTAAEVNLTVGSGESFTLNGGEKTFTDLTLESSANVTSLNSIYFSGSSTALKIHSETVNLYRTEIRDSADLCMVLDAPSVALNLSGTNVMTSVRDNAILAKSVTVAYTNSGLLELTGNLLTSGTIDGTTERIEFTDRGEIQSITDEDFAKFARGMYTVTFDPCGGSVSETSRECYLGEAIGTLPVPTFEYYDFNGWFTEPEGGEQVTEATVLENNNITLYAQWTRRTAVITFNANGGKSSEESRTVSCGDALETLPTAQRDYFTFLGWFTGAEAGEQVSEATVITETEPVTYYAHWEQKPQQGWALASEAPADAEIVSRKWTYSQTTNTESTNSTMDGFTQTGSYWSQTGSGSFNYSTDFPSGFDTSHYIYTSFQKSAYSAYENVNNKREVSTSWAGYVYWHWMYDTNGSKGTANRAINNAKGTGSDNGFWYQYFGAFTSTNGDYESSTGYCNSKGIRNYIIPERTAYADCQGATRWFRFDYYICYYTDYVRMYQFTKTEDNLESTSIVYASDTISNVQEWVMYREK